MAIEPIATTYFQTAPVTFFKVLGYMTGQTAEWLYAGFLEINEDQATFRPSWYTESGPTLHGRMDIGDSGYGPVFWLRGAGFGTYINQITLNSERAASGPAESGSVFEASGGMDDVVIYRPNDLLVRTENEFPLVFGQTWDQDRSSYLVTHDSDFVMNDTPVCSAHINQLEFTWSGEEYYWLGNYDQRVIPVLLE